MSKSRIIVLSTLILLIGSFVSKPLGFLRESVLAYFFGATKVTDAYVIAMSVPTFILLGIASAIGILIVPIVSRVEKEQGQRGVFKFISNITNFSVIASALLVVVSIAILNPLIRTLAPGLDNETIQLTAKLALIMLPTAVMTMVQTILNSLLQYKGDFSITALMGILQNLVTISFIVFASRYIGITAAAIGTLLSAILITALLFYRLKDIGYRHSWFISFKDDFFQIVLRMLAPLMAAGAVNQLGTMVIRGIGTNLTEGSVASINYAQRLSLMPYTIIGTSIITVFYPTISRQFHESGTQGYLNSLYRSMSTLYFALAPIAAGVAFLALPIVGVVYQRGAFTEAMSTSTSVVLEYLAISIPFMGLSDLFSKALLIMKDTITNLIVAILSTIIGVALAWGLSPSLSYLGLAIGMSGQYLASLVLFGFFFIKKIDKEARRFEATSETGEKGPIPSFINKLLVSMMKTTIATISMTSVLFLMQRLIGEKLQPTGLIEILALIIGYTCAGGIIFILVAALLRAEELAFMINILKGLIGKLARKLSR